jgi:hypothetical protein
MKGDGCSIDCGDVRSDIASGARKIDRQVGSSQLLSKNLSRGLLQMTHGSFHFRINLSKLNHVEQ